ncbi:hypothetical protein IR148_01255 [Dysgonomonas mossii]|uniref:Cytoplasmic membrane protein n=1 Tax=Dysgonomonas mossii TaxID=163665 RepID=A0A4Y9ISM5_9BACT|nr:hypothetical protein [Dysgonomonas mossii]MBF0759672.1 hypothetical protein [Dysgonomonas mossii]TFU90635.1 hypothetical protein E4T88_01255 [Dysgonomonas mossii]
MKANEAIQIQEKKLILKIRVLVLFYIFALFFWGITAFPIETELKIICGLLGISLDVSPDVYTGFTGWIATVTNGVIDTNHNYPFFSYGTDWMAFSHLVIAVAFIGLYVKPVRNIWIVYFAMIACAGVIPLALICGAIRGLPLWWRLIDCSFCVFGLIPLYFLHVYIKRLEKLIDYTPTKY